MGDGGVLPAVTLAILERRDFEILQQAKNPN